MLERKEPLTSGIDTHIDMIERQMEGGVWVRLPIEVFAEMNEYSKRRLPMSPTETRRSALVKDVS